MICFCSAPQGNASRQTLMGKINSKHETGAVAKPALAKTDADEIFGFFAGKGSITGDVVSPALSEEEWGELY